MTVEPPPQESEPDYSWPFIVWTCLCVLVANTTRFSGWSIFDLWLMGMIVGFVGYGLNRPGAGTGSSHRSWGEPSGYRDDGYDCDDGDGG